MTRLSAALIGRDQEYFRLFEEASKNNLRAAELLDQMRRNPGKISFGSAGTGSSDHLTFELFSQLTGTTARRSSRPSGLGTCDPTTGA